MAWPFGQVRAYLQPPQSEPHGEQAVSQGLQQAMCRENNLLIHEHFGAHGSQQVVGQQAGWQQLGWQQVWAGQQVGAGQQTGAGTHTVTGTRRHVVTGTSLQT
jgi:hypothetical protein